MNVSVYNDFVEGNDLCKLYYDNTTKPSLLLTRYDEYINNIDKKFLGFLSEELNYKLSNKKYGYFYFVCIKQKGDCSDKIFDYYKIWKKDYKKLPLFDKGIETRYSLFYEEVYISCAKFEQKNISIVLNTFLNNKGNSFIFYSKDINLQNEETFYASLCDEKYRISKVDSFCYGKLFSEMKKDEILVKYSFDGECVGVDIYETQP